MTEILLPKAKLASVHSFMIINKFAVYILKDIYELFLKNSTLQSMKIGKNRKHRQMFRQKYTCVRVYFEISE